MTACVQHVITGLNVGGAELMLSKLASRGKRFRHVVTSLSGSGVVGKSLAELGVTVRNVHMRKDPRAAMDLWRFGRVLEAHGPIVVQTWLYHADLAGGLAARRIGIPVVWNLRQTSVGRGVHKLNTALTIRLCALLSRVLPHTIVCGSNSALAVHRRMGFDARRMTVIRNGVDTRAFSPDLRARRDVRNELEIDTDVMLLGRIGRFHPQKDYKGFIETASRIAGRREKVVFLLAGGGLVWDNRQLVGWIREHGLENKVRLLGQRNDVSRIMAACDLLVSSSIFGEGFPNVVAEAMACGVPCIATDVGDSAELIDDRRRVVAPADYGALAEAALGVLRLPEERRLQTANRDRDRIVRQFDIDDMVRNYETLYEQFEQGRQAHLKAF